MDTIDLIGKLWPILILLISGFVGYVELRFKVVRMEKDNEVKAASDEKFMIAQLEKEKEMLRRIDSKDDKIWNVVELIRMQVSTVLQTMARIEGKVEGLNNKNQE